MFPASVPIIISTVVYFFQAVKAMRYPADAFKPAAKKKEGKDDKTTEELAKEIEEELEDEDF
jgi:hypothetical protein